MVWVKRILLGGAVLGVLLVALTVLLVRRAGAPMSPEELQSLQALKLERPFLPAGLEPFLIKQDLEGRAADDYKKAFELIGTEPRVEAAVKNVMGTETKEPQDAAAVRAALEELGSAGFLALLQNAVRRKDQSLTGTFIFYEGVLGEPKNAQYISAVALTVPAVFKQKGRLAEADGKRPAAEAYYRAAMSAGYHLGSQPNIVAQLLGGTVVVGASLLYGQSRKAAGDFDTGKRLGEQLTLMAENAAFKSMLNGIPKLALEPERFDLLRGWLREPAFQAVFSDWTAMAVSMQWSRKEIAAGEAGPERKAFLEEMSSSPHPVVRMTGEASARSLARMEQDLREKTPEERRKTLRELREQTQRLSSAGGS